MIRISFIIHDESLRLKIIASGILHKNINIKRLNEKMSIGRVSDLNFNLIIINCPCELKHSLLLYIFSRYADEKLNKPLIKITIGRS